MKRKITPTQSYLERARNVAREIASKTGFVSADRVQEKLPLPKSLDKNILGALFRQKDQFKFVGYRKSTRKEAKGRVLRYYKYNNV